MKIFCLSLKELRSLFYSPIAYIAAGLFLVLSGFFFSIIIYSSKEASLRYFFSDLVILFLFFCPLFTMRSFSEEKKLKTMELLETLPVNISEIVIGKLCGLIIFFLLLCSLTLIYPIILFIYSNPELGPIYSAYIGFILFGIAMLTVGMFASSLSENQIISAVLSFVFLMLLWIISFPSYIFKSDYTKFFKYLSIMEHMENFQKGLFDFGDLFYYISLILFFIFLTIKSLQAQKALR